MATRGCPKDTLQILKDDLGIIRLVVMINVRFPLSPRNVEDLPHERSIDVNRETIRYWWQRFGPVFAPEIEKRCIQSLKSSKWRWHLDEVVAETNDERKFL